MSDDLKSVESNPKELIGDFYIKVTKNIGSKSEALFGKVGTILKVSNGILKSVRCSPFPQKFYNVNQINKYFSAPHCLGKYFTKFCEVDELEIKNSTYKTAESLIDNFFKSDLKSAISKLSLYEHNQDYIILYDSKNQLTSFKLIDLSKIKSAVDYKQNIDNYVSKGSKAIIYPKDYYDLEKLREFKEQYNTNILAIAPIYIPEHTYIFIDDRNTEVKAFCAKYNKLPALPYAIGNVRPRITLDNGLMFSVQASNVHFCSPQINYRDIYKYKTVEVGVFDSEDRELKTDDYRLNNFTHIDELRKYQDSSSIFFNVPVKLVEGLYNYLQNITF